VKVGLLGCGNVGAALVELLDDRREAIHARTGIDLEITRIAVRSTSKERPGALAPELLTTDAESVVTDPSVDIVVEVIGGIEPARSLVLKALEHGKPVVTANKELLANVGADLYAAADKAGVDLLFETAAAGAIPIIGPLRESLLGEDITRITGIFNGTTNYILTRMTEDGASYGDALAEAQRLGFAERDPTADVEGYDSGAKAAIMASLAFGANVVAGDVYHEGISNVTKQDIAYARSLGYEIKLLAIAETGFTDENGERGDEVAVRVHPAMIPQEHPLAAVRDSFNAVFVEGAASGELMFYGRGAGGFPSASAVLGDVIEAAQNLRNGTHRSVPTGPRVRIRPIDELVTEYYVNIEVHDTPGVLAAVAGVFGKHGVSIRSMEQHEASDGMARIAFITHDAKERDLQATLHELRALDVVEQVVGFLRVAGE